MKRPKIFAICGSTRLDSANLNLIKAIRDLALEKFEVEIYTELSTIAPFNPDRLSEVSTAADLHGVRKLRHLLANNDAVLICSHEYAIGVPGVLKNAIDWTVSTTEFSGKPVALITAGTGGHHAHKSLLGTLLIIEAKLTEETQMVVSMVKTKLQVTGGVAVIADVATQESVRRLLASLEKIILRQIPDECFLRPPPFDET